MKYSASITVNFVIEDPNGAFKNDVKTKLNQFLTWLENEGATSVSKKVKASPERPTEDWD